MLRFLVRRVSFAALSVLGVVTMVFALTKLIPGDPARVAAGRTATTAQVEQARHELGLDKSVPEQFFNFVIQAMQGNLGISTSSHQPVVADLALSLPVTLQLVVLAMLFTLAVGIPLGTLAAVRYGGPVDSASRIFMVVCAGVPAFCLAILFQWFLGSQLGWFPISGSNGFGVSPVPVTGFTVLDSILGADPEALGDSLSHLLLPALALSAPFMAFVARNVRSTMIAALQSDYMSFALSKGAGGLRLLVHHGLRSVSGSTMTIVGMQFGWMIGAALLVETVFSLPGIGVYLNAAILNQDTFAVLGSVLVIGVLFTTANLVVDVLQLWLDPRVRNSHLSGTS